MLLTNAELALAGLLAESPKHPYQLEKDVEQRDMRQWTDLSMSSIYKLLKKMERRGLVISENSVTEENRLRRIYSLTATGNDLLKQTLRSTLTEPEIQPHPVNVALYFMGTLPKKERLRCLEIYRDKVAERAECYSQLEDYMKSNNCTIEHLSIATRLQVLHRTEADWLNRLIDSYNKS